MLWGESPLPPTPQQKVLTELQRKALLYCLQLYFYTPRAHSVLKAHAVSCFFPMLCLGLWQGKKPEPAREEALQEAISPSLKQGRNVIRTSKPSITGSQTIAAARSWLACPTPSFAMRKQVPHGLGSDPETWTPSFLRPLDTPSAPPIPPYPRRHVYPVSSSRPGVSSSCSREGTCVAPCLWTHSLPAVRHEEGSPGACNFQLPLSWYRSCRLPSARNTWWYLQTFGSTSWWCPRK